MKNTGWTVTAAAGWRVCEGGLFLNGEEVPVHPEVVGIVSRQAGLDPLEACGAISEADVRRIFFMERALLKRDLAPSRRDTLGRTA